MLRRIKHARAIDDRGHFLGSEQRVVPVSSSLVLLTATALIPGRVHEDGRKRSVHVPRSAFASAEALDHVL